MSLWVKLHTDILGDVKLMRAARRGAQALELLPWLIAFAKLCDDDGRLTVNGEPAEIADIAPLIPCTTDARIAQCLAECHKIGILAKDDDGALRFVTWEQRAAAKPSDDKDAVRQRVADHRERKRAKKNRNARPVTPGNALQVGGGNATEVEVEGEVEGDVEPELQPTSRAGEAESPERSPAPLRGFAALRERLRDPGSEPVIQEFLAGAAHAGTNPEFWIAEINGWLDGLNLPNLTPASEPDVVQALRDYLAVADRDFHPVHVRQFPARAARARLRAEKAQIRFAGTPAAADELAEAAEIVQQILDQAETVTPQAGGSRRVLRASAIDALGPEIAAAFRNSGGSGRFLETDPADLGFLHRDFARHLAAARKRLASAPAQEVAHA